MWEGPNEEKGDSGIRVPVPITTRQCFKYYTSRTYFIPFSIDSRCLLQIGDESPDMDNRQYLLVLTHLQYMVMTHKERYTCNIYIISMHMGATVASSCIRTVFIFKQIALVAYIII